MTLKRTFYVAAFLFGLLVLAGLGGSAGAQLPEQAAASNTVGRAALPNPSCITNYTYTLGSGSIVPGTTDIGNHCNDCSTNITLPFAYQLYDQTFTAAAAGSNGELSFGTDAPSHTSITCQPNNAVTYTILPYWTHQNTAPNNCLQCGIFTSVSGVAPNRIFNVEWRDAYPADSSGGILLRYEVRLYESQTRFDAVYGLVNLHGVPNNDSPLTVGVEKNPSAFTQVGCDPTGGGAPPVTAGQLYVYTLAPCATATATSTTVPTSVPTDTPVPTNTSVATATSTAQATSTSVATATSTAQPTSTSVATATSTAQATSTGVATATSTPFPTYTPVATYTPNPTYTPYYTPPPNPTFTATSTSTPTATATFYPYPSPTLYPTNTPYPTSTAFPTYSPLPTYTPAPTYTPYYTPGPNPTFTATSTSTPTATATFYPYPTPSAYPTSTPYPTSTAFPTYSPVPTYTPAPTYTPYGTPPPNPTYTATVTSSPTATATFYPYPSPTNYPTSTPYPPNPTYTSTPVGATPTATSQATSTATTIPTYTPVATYTPLPTYTPYYTPPPNPTFTATSTWTPTATATYYPYPSPTLYPTQTPYPTSTAFPTYSPLPTYTPVPTYTPYGTPPPNPSWTPTLTAEPSATATFYPYPTQTPYPTSTPYPPGATYTPSATETPCGISFSDVHPADYFYQAVIYLYCHGVISGYSDGTFRPYNYTTRSQMVKIVVLGFRKPISTPTGGAHTFTDVTRNNNFFNVIETAAALNIVSGYDCGGPGEPCDPQNRPYFRPYNNVTRGQLAKIDVIGAGWAQEDPPTPSFNDVPRNSVFYTVIETAHCHGVLDGYNDGSFRPYTNATRGQISKIVYLSIVNPPTTCGGAVQAP